VIAAVVGAGVGIGGSYALLGGQHAGSQSTIKVSHQQAPQATVKSGSVEAAAKKIKKSVVTITVKSGSSGDLGSGVVTDDKGHILTNAHVVSAADNGAQSGGFGLSSGSEITVTSSSGKTADAKVVGIDKPDDLAVLKTSTTKTLKPATFAKSGDVQTGQSVVAVGAPLGLSQTVTSGIVSNTNRPVRSGKGNDAVYEAIQTDAPINPGNSGGPLVNLSGQVVGINSAIKSTGQKSSGQGGQAGNIGIGFAIPSHIATRVSSQLISHGEAQHAALGVTISGSARSPLAGAEPGVPLRSVVSGKAADKAGLKTGDKVTKVGDFDVTTSNGLIAAIRYHAPGEKVAVSYEHNGSGHTVTVTLGKS
jgi:putative serine protease PepD